MALPTGTISLSDVDVYLGAPATQLITLNDSPVRALAGVPTGTIAMSNLQGKPGTAFILNIGSDTANLDVRAAAVAAGWDQTNAVTVNIASGVKIYSGSTGSYAMTVSGAFPGGLTINNSGYILGQGGAGGTGGGAGSPSPGSPGLAGGPALSAGSVFFLNNQGTIGSGGGGGGGGGGYYYSDPKTAYGGGGGGGGGGRTGPTPSSGGPGGSDAPGAGFGTPGADGTFAAAGNGGGGGSFATAGAAGGTWGSNGSTAAYNPFSSSSGGAGGAAGTAITGYGLVQFTNTGTILGPTSNGDETLLTISTPQTSTYNINTQATAAGWNGTKRLRVVINPGVSVVSASTGTAAMVATGSFPNALVITNNGYIVGAGGTGGAGGATPSGAGSAGGAGGIGLSITGTTSPVFMVNNGIIGGGGGGGGGGRASGSNAGGGGGGAGLGVGGSATSPATSGSPGTAIAYGSGGSAASAPSGAGGNGGPIGTDGSAGGNSGAAGGSAGWAVYGDNLITYVTTGSIIGARQSTVANLTIAAPTANLNLRTYALAQGWNGVATVNATISPGVSVSSSSAGTPAFSITGTFPNGVTLTNNGTISAAGGAGGRGAGWGPDSKGTGAAISPGTAGVGGGTGLYVTTSSVPVTNNGTIAAGGGGGGGAYTAETPYPKIANKAHNGGPGGGGGAGNVGGPGGAGGAGIEIGGAYSSPGATGNAGGSTTGGAAINGGGEFTSGAGGARGSAGTAGAGYAGGAAGSAVVGTANITWLATGTRIGPIS